MNCLVICLSFLVFLANIEFGLSWKFFSKGRRYGGNLGEPSKSTTILQLPQDEWFDQTLDHFDKTNNKTWKQRYFTNNAFYKKGGPVFLMIGGEGEASAKWMAEGAWIHYAKENNAFCFQLEHRYYGKSRPTENLTTDNLIYLTSEQALEDLASFIVAMNKKYKFNSTKWIAFGGSYPGSLAAWLRSKYSNIVYGSVSSSGPLLAEADFKEYYQVVAESLETFSDNCVSAIAKSIVQVDMLMKHRIGMKNLDDLFKLCDPVENSIDNPLDISNLYESLASNFAGVVQYNEDYSPHATITIDQVCDIMINQTIGPQVNRLAEVNTLLLHQQNQTCLDYKYEKMLKDMKNVSWDGTQAEGGRQWTFQTCNEFGFYQTSDKPSYVFGDKFDVNFFIKQCSDIFGNHFDDKYLNESINKTNKFYGGLHNPTTNVIYVHGTIDPWHALGLTKSTDPKMPTIYIEGTAHCANMYEPQPNDKPQLKEAREKISQFIKDLLK